MMDFLRALAPSHAAKTRTLAPSHAAKTRAVPILRSRFEDSRPLTRLPAVDVDTPSRSSLAEPREHVATNPAITRSVEPVREDHVVAATPAERASVAPADGRVTRRPSPDPQSVPSMSQPLRVRPVPAAAHEAAAGVEPVTAVRRVIDASAFLRATSLVSAPLRTAASPVGGTMPEPAAPAAGRGPLSSNAVAARAESRAETRPIIHVTIDRIDVRAPSAPERPSSRPRSRSNASASLSEYLRSRQSSRTGGAS